MLLDRIIKSILIIPLCLALSSCEKVAKDFLLSRQAVLANQESSTWVLDIPRIGSTKELGKDETCGENKDILAYAETYKFHIYICGQETTNKPESMVILKVRGNSTKAVISDNPSISWNKSYVFGQGEFGVVLNRPSSLTYDDYYKPDIPEFYTYVRFANEIYIREKIRVYLFNEKVEPNYKRVMLLQNSDVREHFLKYSPTYKCKLSEGRSSPPATIMKAFEIAPKKYLFEMGCYLTGYNREFQYVLYSQESSTPRIQIVPFSTLDPGLLEARKIQNIESLSITGSLQFFPEDNTLRAFQKGIGAGGCGNAAEYKLIEGKFELQEFRKYDDCHNARSPQEFPKIYP